MMNPFTLLAMLGRPDLAGAILSSDAILLHDGAEDDAPEYADRSPTAIDDELELIAAAARP